ncbi:MAG: hypothetical protein LUE98_01295 [Tannerellaceae bacterium]|nr:hypothetical protein [Tannerellaceae bacterium]
MSLKELTFTVEFKDGTTATSPPLKVGKVIEITDITKDNFVPLGIPNCETKLQTTDLINITFRLKYFKAKEFGFRIENEQGDTIYEQRFLPDIIVTPNEEEPHQETYHNPAVYIIKWDGFDQYDIYNSRLMKGNFTVTVFATLLDDSEETDRKTIKWDKMIVDWMDVTINKQTKIIDVLLRLDLRDKGAVGLNPEKYDPDSKIYKQADWKKVPKSVINAEKKEPIKSRTKSFEQLKQLVFDGVNKYWSREVTIGKDTYTVNTIAIDSNSKCMDYLELRYCTNESPGRSGNPGSATINPYTWVANIAYQRVYYNVGYLYFPSGWKYRSDISAENNFKETAAHEMGHEILKAFGGATYSYEHKGTSTMSQKEKKGVEYKYPPKTKEIDLMKYYDFNEDEDDDSVFYNYYSRIKAAEEDILGMLWLIKTNIK